MCKNHVNCIKAGRLVVCKKKGRDPVYKCIYCGKYIKYDDIGTDKIDSEFTPETDYTREELLFWHTECEKKSRCSHCHLQEECKKEFGEEYQSVIGTHHCRFSWDKFIKPI